MESKEQAKVNVNEKKIKYDKMILKKKAQPVRRSSRLNKDVMDASTDLLLLKTIQPKKEAQQVRRSSRLNKDVMDASAGLLLLKTIRLE